MLFGDTYKTIRLPSEGTFRDRGSKFIAYAYPLNSESELKTILNNLKSDHPKAGHHCWAFRLTPDRSIFRLNDDGEPSGTAGRPILNTLLSYDLTNVVVVVVRYFGGTLLGVPGLINAYKKATVEALGNSEIVELTIKAVYEIEFDHLQMNAIMKVIKEEGIEITRQLFDNRCVMTIEMRQSSQEQVLSRLKKFETLKQKYISTH